MKKDLFHRLETLIAERIELKAEIAELRRRLDEQQKATPEPPEPHKVEANGRRDPQELLHGLRSGRLTYVSPATQQARRLAWEQARRLGRHDAIATPPTFSEDFQRERSVTCKHDAAQVPASSDGETPDEGDGRASSATNKE